MRQAINLLPWRLAEFRRKSRNMLIKLSIFSLVLFLSLIVLFFFQQQMNEELHQQQEKLQLHKQQLNETQQKVTALQQKIQGNETTLILSKQDIPPFLALLQQLPLTQGELKQLNFNAEELRLQGWVANQQEFETLDHFLTQFTWLKQKKLEKLDALSQGELHFEYQLIFANSQEKMQ